jgi:hypothetical protein
VPKRLRGMLADRPRAIAALTKIFLTEIEQHLLAASGGAPDAETPGASRPRLGGISFLHRFGSALNHHVHLHACVTDGVFVPAADDAGCDAPPAFLPARPITQADLAALTERVRRRVIRWFRLARLLDAAAAADMVARENSGFSVDARVRITLLRLQLRVYCQLLEQLLRYCARPPFALECPACGGDIRLIAIITEPAETAGRSRPTSNRRFASGRRPGWLRPRKAAPPPISPARGPPTDSRRARPDPLSTATSFRRRHTTCPQSTSTASDRCRQPGHDKAPRPPDSERLRADTRKTPLPRGKAGG